MECKQKINIPKREERIETEVITTDQIHLWTGKDQEKLRTELENIFSCVFPNMPKEDLDVYVSDYFIQPGGKLRRQAILFKNQTDKLIGVNICDYGKVEYHGNVIKGAYLIASAVLPGYQGYGIGKIIGIKLLTELQPDVLFTTCVQSSALHSRINLCKKGLVSDFEVYPRLEEREEREILITIPCKDLDFVIHIFKKIYLGVAEGKQKNIDEAIRNMTVLMVRKNIHGEMYDFNPWEKNGREDKLAKALGVTDKDGVLVMFKKKIG